MTLSRHLLLLLLTPQLVFGASGGGWRRHRPDPPPPPPPDWLQEAAATSCPGVVPGTYEAYYARGGFWLVKLTDARGAAPKEVLFLPGHKAGMTLRLGDVFYSGDQASLKGNRTKFTLALRVP